MSQRASTRHLRSAHPYARTCVRSAMPRGVRHRVACTAVALLLVCIFPGTFSSDSKIPAEEIDLQVGRQAPDARGTARVMRLGKRVVDIDAEIELELAGRQLLVRGKTPQTPHRGLLETSGSTELTDVRWRLLDDEDASVPTSPQAADAPWWGDGSGAGVTQFLVATDGSPGGFNAVATALEAHGGGVAGVIPPNSYVAVGGPAAATAARDLAMTLWVGLLTIDDIVVGGLDTADAAKKTSLDTDGRALIEVSVPSLFVLDTNVDVDSKLPRARRARGVSRTLAEAMASAFAATAQSASGDPDAWARPMASWARPGAGTPVDDASDAKVTRVIVGVRPEGIVAAVHALAAHRAAHLVAPRERVEIMRPVPSGALPRPPRANNSTKPPKTTLSSRDLITGRRLTNAESIPGLQGDELVGTTSETPFWDAGITGTGQIVGMGDTGADRTNCYLSGDDKFVLMRAYKTSVIDEDGHGTHCAGSAVGYSATAGANADGSAYDAKIAFTDFSETDGSLLSLANMGDDYFEHSRVVGARIHSDSWGSLSSSAVLATKDGTPTSAYFTPSQELDAYAAEHLDFLPMFAIANQGPSVMTYGIPGNAKNSLSIGATLSPSSVFYSPDSYNLYVDAETAAAGQGWFSFLPQIEGELGYQGVGVYALEIGGPNAAHYAHLSGEIRTMSAVSELSSPASGLHTFDDAIAVVADPADACSASVWEPLDVSGKVVLIGNAHRTDSCLYATIVSNIVTAGGVAVVFVHENLVKWYDFPSYTQYDDSGEAIVEFVPRGSSYVTPFFIPRDGVAPAPAAATIPVLGVPKTVGELLMEIVKDEPATTLSVSGVMSSTATAEPRHENMAVFSSGGPTTNDRIKPDLVAPGDSITSAAVLTGTDGEDTCSTTKKSGTSMATPLAAGMMTLLRQYFTDGYYPTGTKTSGDEVTPSAALLRAVAINGARSLKGFDQNGNPIEPPPSSRQGWGRLNLASSVRLVSDGVNTDAADTPSNMIAVDAWSGGAAASLGYGHQIAKTGDSQGYCLNVYGSTEELRATLAWTDPESDTAGDGGLVNDLDLKLLYLPTYNATAVKTLFPLGEITYRTNTAERAIWSAPAIGNYWVSVDAYSIAGADSQTFALAITGQVSLVEDVDTREACMPPSPPPPSPPSPPPPSPPPSVMAPSLATGTITVTGRALLVGYLSDCGVFLDANGDGTHGADELTATTDVFGGYSFGTDALDADVAKVVVSTDTSTYSSCVDTFTGKAPGMLAVQTPASSVDSLVATPLTMLAAALVRGVNGAASAASTSTQANLWITQAFGLAETISTTLSTTDYLALAASGDSDAMDVFVAASTSANVIATLSVLLTPACGSWAAAEAFVVDAIARRVITATSALSRRKLHATSSMGLESASVVTAIADDSVTTAVAAGTISNASQVNSDAITAVSTASAAAASHLRTASATASDDPTAFFKTAAAVSAVVQSPEMRTAILAASVVGVAGLEDTVAASSSTLIADLQNSEKLQKAVTEAEASIVVDIPQSPPPPSPSPPPPAWPPWPPFPDANGTAADTSESVSGDFVSGLFFRVLGAAIISVVTVGVLALIAVVAVMKMNGKKKVAPEGGGKNLDPWGGGGEKGGKNVDSITDADAKTKANADAKAKADADAKESGVEKGIDGE